MPMIKRIEKRSDASLPNDKINSAPSSFLLSKSPSSASLLSLMYWKGRTEGRGGGSEGDIRGFGESGDKRHGRHM
jgi:hypothetical protein